MAAILFRCLSRFRLYKADGVRFLSGFDSIRFLYVDNRAKGEGEVCEKSFKVGSLVSDWEFSSVEDMLMRLGRLCSFPFDTRLDSEITLFLFCSMNFDTKVCRLPVTELGVTGVDEVGESRVDSELIDATSGLDIGSFGKGGCLK